MRIRATFYLEEETNLPYSLNYPISSYLYQCISQADPALGEWLHNEGLSYQGRSYKPIIFSNLHFEYRRFQSRSMKVKGKVTFQVDSIQPTLIQRLMEGMWKKGCLQLLDIQLPLKEIQLMGTTTFQPEMSYRSLSPIVVPMRLADRLHFCNPLESDFYEQLKKSARNWYWLKWQKELPADVPFRIRLLHPEKFSLKKAAVLTEYKEKKIKGYQVPLWIEAPPDLQQVLMEAGIGSLSSQGFGFLEPMKEVTP
ncbi:CRISPR-associated endoribonuclease Cas6 [Hazenella coriacea]|uniref:CRISPR-associated endoribonuclease n=1 Tax=Hazenella coriacea TaxID=1179467 RepID=A0A4R3L5P5_9BACL|nr:CRISPR-associated endoribonuclease Cas6 [Hazenella coriacea]TCS94969.1 CRISPR-associated endoribonuclease Cas6 [Hazenella coriacea]